MGRKIKVILQPVKFRNRDHIAILCPSNSEVDAIVREFEDTEWSTGYRFWHTPLKKEKVKELTEALRKIAIVDNSALKNFQYDDETEEKQRRKRIKIDKPSSNQKIKLEKFKDSFLKSGYSDGTVKVYLSMLNVFFGWHKDKDDQEITNGDVEKFLHDYIDANHFTTNYKRLMTNSLRRYFTYIGRDDLKNI